MEDGTEDGVDGVEVWVAADSGRRMLAVMSKERQEMHAALKGELAEMHRRYSWC